MIWGSLQSKHKEFLICTAILILIVVCMMCWPTEKNKNTDQMTENEARLAEMLSSIKGTGKVEVLISQNDTNQAFSFTEDSNSGTVQGVIICAEGVENFDVYCKLQSAVATALDLSADQIEIYPLKTNHGR